MTFFPVINGNCKHYLVYILLYTVLSQYKKISKYVSVCKQIAARCKTYSLNRFRTLLRCKVAVCRCSEYHFMNNLLSVWIQSTSLCQFWYLSGFRAPSYVKFGICRRSEHFPMSVLLSVCIQTAF